MLIVNNFTALGQDAIRVTGVNMSGELGSFSLTGLPLYLDSGESKTANMTIRIPVLATPGNHTVTIAVSWQYLSSLNSTWTDAPPIIISGNIPVQAATPPSQSQGPNTGNTPSFTTQDPSDWLTMTVNQYLLPGGAILWILSFLGLALVLRNKKPSLSQFPRFCPNCRIETGAMDRFCPNCGARLSHPKFVRESGYSQQPGAAERIVVCQAV